MHALAGHVAGTFQVFELVGDLQRITIQFHVTSVRAGGGLHAFDGRRGHLTTRHTIDTVVDEDDSDALATVAGVDSLSRTDGGKVTVTLVGEDQFVRAKALDGRCQGRCAAVRCLFPVDVDVVGYNLSRVGGAENWMNTLKNQQSIYRRYRDYSILAVVVAYALSLIDAYVDAQLFDFDISPDLTLNVEPQIYYDLQHQQSTEIKLAIRF